MKQDIKQQWIAALRSGDYKQGKGTLNNTLTNEYCCLGVLCDLAEKAGVVQSAVDKSNHRGFSNTKYGMEYSGLPMSVQVWADLRSANPQLPDERGGLIGLNDALDYSFEGIAAVIEECL